MLPMTNMPTARATTDTTQSRMPITPALRPVQRNRLFMALWPPFRQCASSIAFRMTGRNLCRRFPDKPMRREASVHASVGAIAVLAVALAAMTGCSNVSLKQYYARVPPTAPIDIDPIGGYMLLYWVDSDGTACHGAPGLSGQPGPAAITVAKPAAVQDAIGGASITAAQLDAYQIIPYTVSDYRKSSAGGFHFFQ